MKKTVLVSAVLLLPLIFLTGCSKVSLTGSTGAPPADGGTPPSGAPAGAPASN